MIDAIQYQAKKLAKPATHRRNIMGIHFFFNKKNPPFYFAICTAIVIFFFIFNPQGLSFDYGSGNGRYADRADSFSEYIVRNTIKRNILNKNDSSLLPILTKGYDDGDYAYYPDGYTKYRSNLIIQTIPATILAKIFRLNTEAELDRFFVILRSGNALLFSVFLIGIFLHYCSIQKINLSFLVPFIIGTNAGFIYFSQNLYFSSFLIILPAYYISRQIYNNKHLNKFLILLFGCLYFLRGFEFSTIFALLTAASAALFTSGSLIKKAKAASLVFSLICASFVIAILLHIFFVSLDTGLSVHDSVRDLFARIQHRTQSITGVPFPFGVQFIKVMHDRWGYPAFSISANGIALSQQAIIIAMMLGLIFRFNKITDNEKILYLYGFFGYASWYIFAYQHIMWHNMYDWYIFALTMGISFGLLLIFYLSLLIERFQHRT
ncbi:hypothetical protein ACMHYJ_02395 [Castellaniella hirudinis]|uniref:hypothetical protein n=1 Tax=Castellaniella hirudinis TaxID=1144617 RepID=UPI0039C06CB2